MINMGLNMNKFIQLPLLLKITVIFFLITSCWGIIITIVNTASYTPTDNTNIYYIIGFKIGYFTSRMTQNILFLIMVFGILYRKKWTVKFTIITFVYSIIYDGYSFAHGFARGAKLELTMKILVFSYLIILIQYIIWYYIISRKKNRETYIN